MIYGGEKSESIEAIILAKIFMSKLINEMGRKLEPAWSYFPSFGTMPLRTHLRASHWRGRVVGSSE